MRGIIFNKFVFSLLCTTLLSVPFFVFSQEEPPAVPRAQPQGYFIDNTKPENERITETATFDDQSNTVTRPETGTNETELTTDQTQTNPEEEQLDIGEPEVEVSTQPEITEDVVQTVEPEAPQQEEPAPREQQTAVKEVAPPMRTFTKKIFVNKDAVHTCTAEVFSVDMSGRSTAQNTLLLTKEADIAYELEVGSLPAGIDVRFTNNNSYYKNIGLEDDAVDFTISIKHDAATGSFTIPLIYTQKGVFDSSVVCQVNVVHQ